MMTRTHIALATFAIVLMTPFAHAERYNVRGADGRFVKQSSAALAGAKPNSSAMMAEHATSSAVADGHAHETTSTPAQKTTLGGWLRSNFTIRSSQRDKLTAATALRKAGRVGEAASYLTHTDKPQGFVEKIAFGRAEMKLNSAARSALKQGARANDFDKAGDAFVALKKMETGGKTTWFSRWRANAAQRQGMKASLRIAAKQGKTGDFASASRSLDLAAGLSNGNESAITRGDARLVKQATKAATRAAKSGDIDGTVSALQVAMHGNGGALPAHEAQAIFDRAYDKAIPKMLKSAKDAYKHGDTDGAAAMLARVQDLQADQGRPATGRAHTTQVELTALVGSRANVMRHAMVAAAKQPATPTAEAHSVVDPGAE